MGRPRNSSAREPDFTSERAVRAAVAAVRDAHADISSALASEDWRRLRPRVARYALTHWERPGDEAWALRVADIYLRSPWKLPPLPPEEVA